MGKNGTFKDKNFKEHVPGKAYSTTKNEFF